MEDNNFTYASTQAVDEISKLKDENKRLKQQVIHWRNSANDTTHMLVRMDKAGPKRYADNFYHPALERILNKVHKENKILVDAVNTQTKHPTGAQLTIETSEQKKQIQNLRDELEQKFRDNRRLQMAIEELSKNQPNKKLDSISRMTERCNRLQTENRNLKRNLMMQENIKDYLKKIVDSLRKEFLHLFCKCVADDGENFLTAIKELDKNGLPDILLKPLCHNQGTNTSEDEMATDSVESRILPIIAQLKIDDTETGYDSGVASLTDEIRQVSIMLRQSEDNLMKKDDMLRRSEENSIKKDNVIGNQNQEIESLKREINTKEHEHEQVLKDIMAFPQATPTPPAGLFGENEQIKKQLQNSQNECSSLYMALQERNEESDRLLEENRTYKNKYDALENSIKKAATQQPQFQQQQYPQYQQQPRFLSQTDSQTVPEPFQSSFPWTGPLGGHFTAVATDGESPSSSNKKPKRQSSEPSFSRSSQDYASSGSSPKRRSQFDAASAAGGAAGAGESSWYQQTFNNKDDVLLTCEICGETYPSAMQLEHQCKTLYKR